MVQLTEPLVDLLDRRAAREGVSRSRVIRDAVEQYLRLDHEAEIDRRIIEGYTRLPDGPEDDWGDLDAWRDALAADRARALEAEERAAGAPPWTT